MGLRDEERCAYCGQPLRLVAGFCAECLAPAPVARRTTLVADARRRAGQQLTEHSPIAQSINTSPAVLAAKPRSRVAILLALVGGAALLIGIISISLRIATGTTPSLPLFADSSLVIRSNNGGATAYQAKIGQPLTITYNVQPKGSQPSEVVLTILVPGQPLSTFAERWPLGTTSRSITLVPAIAGTWQFVLSRNQETLQTFECVVANGP